jgi:hypothetical protein
MIDLSELLKKIKPFVLSWIAGGNGWQADADPWVYVSATSFKVVGKDVSLRFPVGTKLRLKQGAGFLSFYVVAASFSADTTVTITAGSDFTLANATITDGAYSYASSPQGFPDFFSWTPTYTGFSVSPIQECRFQIQGRRLSVNVDTASGGTSSAAGFTMTFPVNARYLTYIPLAEAVNNGAAETGCVRIPVGSNIGTFYHGAMSAAWATSNPKWAEFQGFYEI